MCQRRCSTVLTVHSDLKGEFFTDMYDAYVDIFSSPLKAGIFLDLEHLQIVTLLLQNISVGFVEFFSSLSPSLKTEKNICEGCC